MADSRATGIAVEADATQDAATEATENETVNESTVDGQQEQDPAGAEALGDAGKKALDAMKAKWKEAERVARERDAELAELRAKAEGREAEFQADQERRKVESEALAKADERILKAEIRAAAAKKLADPADALRFIPLDQFEVGQDGEVDASAITEAIEALVKSKPYLAAQGGNNGPVFESPGAHRNGAPVGQLTQADLAGMNPAQINAARAEGRLNDLLGIKN